MRLEGKKIYVADDDENVRDAITMILEEEGADVIGLPDGKKIFTMVSLKNPDCILMDLYTPNSDGFDAIGGIKEFFSDSCPILVVTGHPTDENIARAKDLGATECISKPLEADDLVEVVARLVGR
jgi:DNA-binding response OmpR family regulator